MPNSTNAVNENSSMSPYSFTRPFMISHIVIPEQISSYREYIQPSLLDKLIINSSVPSCMLLHDIS